MAFLASHRRDHHEIGLMEVGEAAEPPKNLQVGLSHVAFRLGDEAALIKAYRELKERDVPISFTVHHGITKSVYFTDPDGNQLEVYCDVARDERAARSPTNTWGWIGWTSRLTIQAWLMWFAR